jgi:A-macroglobulin TED domain/Alpha-2-macroglobulin family/MG2 domain/Carboxypeptidase regulatory-like domain/Macroglobulin domain MG3/A-macroglobulin receptor binding domain/Alpha-2-macroglobulin bait region domain
LGFFPAPAITAPLNETFEGATMSRIWLLFLFCLLVFASIAPLTRAGLTVRVDDATVRILFDEHGTRVLLPIENARDQTLDTRIRIQLLDTDGRTAVTVERDYQLKPGRNELTIPIGSWITGQPQDTTRDFLWYRLSYHIIASGSSQFDEVSSVVSLSQITPDIFALQVASPRKAHEGAAYRVRVSTPHPLTKKPVAGVVIDAELTFDGLDRDDIVLKKSAVTDAAGFATLDYQVPAAVEYDEGNITVTARRGILTETAENDVDVDRETLIMVSTDKPLYQPGQTLHTRVLMFDTTRHALANETADVTVSDPESSTTFRQAITSSRFGVANVDWQIPENARLGDYRIEVKLTGDKYEDAYGGTTVKISRYELPNFTVTIKPDRGFYLADQNAEVEVRGDYLFGQPVKRGHVRVVRETERHWNYREQKYETEEGDKYEGDTDQDGKFVAHINLAEVHADLKGEDYSRYKDLTYAAYFTDPTTNRTEQRRFDLRITKDAIHIYVIDPNSWHAKDLPLEFYVSTSYADGTPASCDIDLSFVRDEDDPQAASFVRTIKTNGYGLAKVTNLALPKTSDDDDYSRWMFRAHDNRGSSGKHVESFSLENRTVVHIITDKSLYRDGEPIRAQILSNRRDATIALDTIVQDKVVQSQPVTLKDGLASVVIPFRRELSGDVTLVAYALANNEDDDEIAYGSRTIAYPHDRDLKLNLALSQDSYRPGQDASATFFTRSATGSGAESALGVVIFDKAVEERARTDREFGGDYAFYRSYRYLSRDFGNVAGISRKDLDHIDWSKRLPDGLDLVAEVLLTDHAFLPRFFGSSGYESAASAFKDLIKGELAPLKSALDVEYQANCAYPKNEEVLRRLAWLGGISFNSLRDPWETPYRTAFFPQRATDVFEMTSAGPDKQFGTDDDFSALHIERIYFRFTGEAINRAVARFHARTGRFIRDAMSLKTELHNEGIDFDSLRDPWGEPYRVSFGVNQTKFQVSVQSAGPDKRFSPKNSDDVSVWISSIDYGRDLQAKLDEVFVSDLRKTSQMPQTDSEFNLVLQRAGISRDELRDPWGQPYYTTFKRTAVYGDRVSVYSMANYGEKPTQKIETTPTTQYLDYVDLRSVGEDGKPGTYDDFTVAAFSRLNAEQAGKDRTPQTIKQGVILPGSTGAISGTVTDPIGAVVPGAKVTARDVRTSLEYASETGDEGTYIVKNLPAGSYQITFESPGFQRCVVINVIVRSSNVTQLNVSLEVGGVSETVSVTSTASAQLDMTSTSRSRVNNFTIDGANVVTKSGVGPQPQVATPRLREYFPETLVWQPSLETDKHGRARLNFKLADNITTWKMSVIGSTEDGQVGVVEKEFRAFQPFFVEHDPPRVLTEGDEISLPVVVRNYLNTQQTVNLDIKPESWFTLLGSATKKVDVSAGDAARGIFDFRATSSVKNGKQRITAIGADANDAIEKPVTVHPDGEEKSVTASDVVSDHAMLTLDIPNTALPNTAGAELKIYPNLLAHVTESVEAIMSRPYGCGEQTISSTYPSLLWLKNYKRIGTTPGGSDLHVKARRYLNAGYARLLNYRDDSGGFTYWGHGDPDVALTAYALRFLTEASDLIAVDEDVITQARAWLIKQQRSDGSWQAHSYYESTENQRRSAMLTAYIARVLAMTEPKSAAATRSTPAPVTKLTASAVALKRAFDYLSVRANEIDEPYLIAAYALGLIEANDWSGAEKLVAKLRRLAHEQNGGNYWLLETNTPFYGWGLAGRVETTALVVQALARYKARSPNAAGAATPASDELINRGLLFLLKEKDRYGVWYSTQATINVLDTLLALLAREVNVADNNARIAEIVVNGRVVKSVELPAPNQSVTPIIIDLSAFVRLGTNNVEIKRLRGSSPASAQAVATYYLPWRESVATQETNWRANGASGLRLVTKFDKTDAKISDEVSCHVEAERVGFRGYGMMLAEIGLPPGADVDRASLETAMKGSDWSISQYDVLPDRVVVYLWPRAGGTKFDFKFKPRLGLRAQTAASIVYDYYNPEARAIVAPVQFVVK